MKQLKEKEYEEFQQYLYNKAHGYIWTPDTLEIICSGNDGDPEQIGTFCKNNFFLCSKW